MCSRARAGWRSREDSRRRRSSCHASVAELLDHRISVGQMVVLLFPVSTAHGDPALREKPVPVQVNAVVAPTTSGSRVLMSNSRSSGSLAAVREALNKFCGFHQA